MNLSSGSECKPASTKPQWKYLEQADFTSHPYRVRKDICEVDLVNRVNFDVL